MQLTEKELIKILSDRTGVTPIVKYQEIRVANYKDLLQRKKIRLQSILDDIDEAVCAIDKWERENNKKP